MLPPKQGEKKTLSSKAAEKEKVISQLFFLIYLFTQQGFIKSSYRVSGNKHVSSVKVVQTKGEVLKGPQTRQSSPLTSLENNSEHTLQKLEAGKSDFPKAAFLFTKWYAFNTRG